MATGIFFNAHGAEHTLELSLFDAPTVWRAIIDGHDVLFFDAEEDAPAQTLISLAVNTWKAGGYYR